MAILDGEFSFWAAAQDSEWTDEHFAVYVSTAGNESVDDFTLVSEEFVATRWPEQYTVDLSSYAGQEGYIAIRHFNSYDNFALVVDDITFTKAPALPVNYNVYADRQLVATVEGETTTYTVAANLVTEGEHTFAVTAVYAGGKESRPATATIDIVTGIVDNCLEITTNNRYYDLQGRSINSEMMKSSNGQTRNGLYIVNGKKMIVR